MRHDHADGPREVLIVGGGFAGVACARRLAKERDVHVTLVDRNNYHQFQPLLYQVATSQLAPTDIAYSLRKLFAHAPSVDVKLAEVEAIDLATRSVLTTDGGRYEGDALVLAAGAQANFFRTVGAPDHALPLYSLDDARALRSRILEVFEAADRDPSLIEQGALTFVVVGGGPTGVEVAGAIADMVSVTMAAEYHDLSVAGAEVHLIDHGPMLLGAFSDRAHDYAARVLGRKGVRLHLGVGVREVGPGHVALSDGTVLRTRCVVWGGGTRAADFAGDALRRGPGGRIEVQGDLSVEDWPGVYAVGDIANIPGPHGEVLPQLGSVAAQAGEAAAENIVADFEGRPRKHFHYHDKGIMAMIGRGAAVAEIGAHRHELHGVVAFSAWLGVHALLMTGVRNRSDAFITWAWDYFSSARGPQVLDRSDEARIAWDEDVEPVAAPAA
jgi:NADH dehydrogenase